MSSSIRWLANFSFESFGGELRAAIPGQRGIVRSIDVLSSDTAVFRLWRPGTKSTVIEFFVSRGNAHWPPAEDGHRPLASDVEAIYVLPGESLLWSVEAPTPQLVSLKSYLDSQAVDRTCSGCGTTQDQDDSAGRVLLARWIERPGDAKILVGARETEKDSESGEVSESRWAKAKRMGAEKRAKLTAAREVGGKALE